MSGSSKQMYLAKARAALAARTAWWSVFGPDGPASTPPAADEVPERNRRGGRPQRDSSAGITCDKSDKSDKRAADPRTPNDEIAWRFDAMRPRVPLTGPIPILYARRLGPVADDCCLSCGEPLTPGNKYNCEPCVQAAWLVLREVRGSDGCDQLPDRGVVE